MTETLLDERLRPSTEAERSKLYRAPDPTDGLEFTMAAREMDCAACGGNIETTEPLWWRDMPEDSPEWRLAQHDPDYSGGAVLAAYCWGCAVEKLGVAVRNYAEERSQCEREERMEEACDALTAGQLTPLLWDEIAIANLGVCDPDKLADCVSRLCGDYSRRFGVDDPAALEQLRSRLWGFAPMAEVRNVPQLRLKPVDMITIEHMPGGRAKLTMEVKLEVGRG